MKVERNDLVGINEIYFLKALKASATSSAAF